MQNVVTDYISLYFQVLKLDNLETIEYGGFTIEKFEDMYLIKDTTGNHRVTLLDADAVLDYITLETTGETL